MAQKKAPVARIEQDTPTPAADEEVRTNVVVESEPAEPEPAKPETVQPKPAMKVDAAPEQSAKDSVDKPRQAQARPAQSKAAVKIDTAITESTASEQGTKGSSAKATAKKKADAAAADTGAAAKGLPLPGPFAWISRLFPGHEHAVLGGLVGLIVALCIFFVGFWQTLFVSLLVCAGIALGQLLDGDPKIIRALRRLLDDLRGTNE